MRLLNCGILADTDAQNDELSGGQGSVPASSSTASNGRSMLIDRLPALARSRLSDAALGVTTVMPLTWVRSAMLVRANSLSHGISGVRVKLLTNLVKLLEQNIIPEVPLRGSISASGDLIPLSYVANLLQGSPAIRVSIQSNGTKKLVGADVALEEAGISPIEFAPKEALALVNGTAFSAGAAALILHDVHLSIVLAQMLTAMAVEALHGTRESFDPYFAQVRPHPGQEEIAQNISSFLWKSQLVREEIGSSDSNLPQDRYSLRTVPQWLGPEIEKLVLAHEQVVTECNSITDNPLMAPDGRVMQGGNFQATTITSAMDTTRNSLQMGGRMLFHQLTEMMNPPTSNGLPPNLTADEPSCDFLMKGMDVAAASYTSELAFLSHGVTPFVMNAEQSNQSLNSLALISARYTQTALDIFTHLTSTMLVAVCQALDLRAIQRDFLDSFAGTFDRETEKWTNKWLEGGSEVQKDARIRLWIGFLSKFSGSASLDSSERFQSIMVSLCGSARGLVPTHHYEGLAQLYQELDQWTSRLAASAQSLYATTLDQHSASHTLPYLGFASKAMYSFVREAQQVPFLRKQQLPGRSRESVFMGGKRGDTLGTYISRIYGALQRGSHLPVVIECLEDAHTRRKARGAREAKL
ncbi:MAG: hypothetical protein Q9157_003176 [Trypethelium eluteriae]